MPVLEQPQAIGVVCPTCGKPPIEGFRSCQWCFIPDSPEIIQKYGSVREGKVHTEVTPEWRRLHGQEYGKI